MKKIYIFLFSCVTVLSAVAQTTPNLYRAVDKEKMNHWVDSVFDAMSYDERIGQLFMVIANPKSDTRNMQRLMRCCARLSRIIKSAVCCFPAD